MLVVVLLSGYGDELSGGEVEGMQQVSVFTFFFVIMAKKLPLHDRQARVYKPQPF